MRRRAALAGLVLTGVSLALSVPSALSAYGEPSPAPAPSYGPFVPTEPAPTPAPALPPAPARLPGVTPTLEQPFTVAEGVSRRTLAFGDAGLTQTLDVYTATSGTGPTVDLRPRPTVLLIHGGGWQIGDSTEWAERAVALVQEQGWTAAALNYRLAPASPWPAQLADADAALRLLHARAGELGVDVDRIGAIGDSAGGQLAALLGEPAPGRPALRSVVTWSGINDLSGLLRQPSAGGCVTPGPCGYAGLAGKVVTDLMGCLPVACPQAYRSASPAALVTPAHAATLALSSEGEQVDPRQSWVMDAALGRARVPSRVEVLPGGVHARGYEQQVWPSTVRFLAATLTPETAAAYPRPVVAVTLVLPPTARVGQPVVLSGVVTPRQLGSTVALQVRAADGRWRTVRQAALVAQDVGAGFRAGWTPTQKGRVVWRALWRGSGTVSAAAPRAVVVR